MAVKHLFTDDEIRNQLKFFGYSSLPEPYFQKFKEDLMKLIDHESDKLSLSSSQSQITQTVSSDHEHSTSRSESSLDSMVHADGGLKSIQISRKSSDPEEMRSSLKLLKSPYMDFYMDASSSGDIMTQNRGSKSDHSPKSEEEDDSSESCCSSQYSSSVPPVRIRKTLRKRNGVSEVSEEAIIPKSTDVKNICDEFENLTLSPRSNENIYSCYDSTLPTTPKLLEPSREQCSCYTSKSFIRPILNQHELHKDDPVSRFHKYNNIWKSLKVPGEEHHRNVRWRVRERMLYPDIPIIEKKSAPSHLPNNYSNLNVKRQAAWEVRSNLAFGNRRF